MLCLLYMSFMTSYITSYKQIQPLTESLFSVLSVSARKVRLLATYYTVHIVFSINICYYLLRWLYGMSHGK